MGTSYGVEISGINKFVRSMERMGVDIQDLKAAFKRVSSLVASDAKQRVHTRGGALAASIREGNAKNKAIVRAGSAKVPYAGVQEYGGYNNITPMNFLRGAAEDNEAKSVRLIDEGISDLIRKHNLR